MPIQTEVSFPAFTLGNGITCIVKLSVPTHDPFLASTVYVIVEFGLAIGFAMVGSLKPVVGNQEYVEPPLANSCTEEPAQTWVSGVCWTVNFDANVTSTVSYETHFVGFVTVK